MFASAGVDTSVRDPKFVVPEVAVGSAQVADQVGTPQAIQKVNSSLASTSGDATIGKIPGVAISDPDLGLPTFLARFDLLDFNSHLASHFHHFRQDDFFKFLNFFGFLSLGSGKNGSE